MGGRRRGGRRRRWTSRAVACALTALALMGCEAADAGTPATDVTAPRPSRVRADDGRAFELIRQDLPISVSRLELTRLIGPEGGTLTLAGQTLAVPEDAVDGPTLFTMRVPLDGRVEVQLEASRQDLFGHPVDVGSRGFPVPLTLELNYARARNVRDDRALVLLRLDRRGLDGVHTVVPAAVDSDQRIVRASLDHFTTYCLAQPRTD